MFPFFYRYFLKRTVRTMTKKEVLDSNFKRPVFLNDLGIVHRNPDNDDFTIDITERYEVDRQEYEFVKNKELEEKYNIRS